MTVIVLDGSTIQDVISDVSFVCFNEDGYVFVTVPGRDDQLIKGKILVTP